MKLVIFKLQKGFTLIELLLVIALIGMVSTIGISTFIGYSRAQALQQAASDFANTLNTAKSKAYAQVNACGSGSLDGYSVVFVTAASYHLKVRCSGVENELTPVVKGDLQSGVSVNPRPTVFFPVLTGGAGGVSASGTTFAFTLNGITKNVIVNSAGVIIMQ
jgi:prepilin-type N-terminal cleavage/methylation domain-containing protein